MEKQYLEDRISENLSLREIAKLTGLSPSTIRHWTKKYGLKSNHKSILESKGLVKVYGKYRHCPVCKTDVETERFYTKRNKKNSSGYCIDCTSRLSHERKKAFKKECVEYKGGKCIECGYSKCVNAMDFHHRDPKEKDFEISKLPSKKLTDKVKKELDKCDLLCCRCHRELHEVLI